jgi:hypothetical protein
MGLNDGRLSRTTSLVLEGLVLGIILMGATVVGSVAYCVDSAAQMPVREIERPSALGLDRWAFVGAETRTMLVLSSLVDMGPPIVATTPPVIAGARLPVVHGLFIEAAMLDDLPSSAAVTAKVDGSGDQPVEIVVRSEMTLTDTVAMAPIPPPQFSATGVPDGPRLEALRAHDTVEAKTRNKPEPRPAKLRAVAKVSSEDAEPIARKPTQVMMKVVGPRRESSAVKSAGDGNSDWAPFDVVKSGR